MKTYKVSVCYEEIGNVFIKAESQEKAMDKVYEHMANDGHDGLKLDCNDRNYEVLDCEAVE